MVLFGQWLLCPDGIVRPVVRGEILTGDGMTWEKAPFLMDTGADRTVLSGDVLKALNLPALHASRALSGVGGTVPTVVVETHIQMRRQDNTPVVFRGQFAAFMAAEALDMSVLGRDITNLFAVIIDRPQDVVCLLGPRHQYTIHES